MNTLVKLSAWKKKILKVFSILKTSTSDTQWKHYTVTKIKDFNKLG